MNSRTTSRLASFAFASLMTLAMFFSINMLAVHDVAHAEMATAASQPVQG